MKKKLTIVLAVLAICVSAFAQQPKYVFYFIGDGMGVNQVNAAEFYQAAVNGNLGTESLAFTQFPSATMATHFSANSDVTDSAASGTALATGNKTRNGRIGLDAEGTVSFTSIAEMAKRCGKKVGIASTVPVNHATPASFFGHQKSRDMGFKLAQDMLTDEFDFYAGSALMDEKKYPVDPEKGTIRDQFKAQGYLICNYEGFKEGWQTAQRILMLPAENQSVTYAIDTNNDTPEHQKDHLTLSQIVESAVTFLMKDNKKGFFLMAEGGKIDGACHGHDAATMIHEVIDFDNAIKIAIDFYNKHPKQTLIVITADHETGGLVLAPKNAETLARLQNQKHSQETISDNLRNMLNEKKLTWDDMKAFLGDNFGFWKGVELNWQEERELRDIYENTIAKRQAGSKKDLYADNALIVAKAVEILDKNAGIYWSCSHSAGYTPVYALGVGAEKFSHKTDNAQIPMIIKEIAGYK